MPTQYLYDPENPTLSAAYTARVSLKLKQLDREMASEKRKREVSLTVRALLYPLTLTRGMACKADELIASIRWQVLEWRSGGHLPR